MLAKGAPLNTLLSAILLLSIPGWHFKVQAGQTAAGNYINDNSDWWSVYSSSDSDKKTNLQEREILSSNFQVLGIGLDEAMFSQAAAKLGEATHVERGDASTGRDQACYVSAGSGERVYLIFERGEVDFTFYLFAGGPSWNGIDRCTASNLVSRTVSTASGLHLGLTPPQVIAILGKPSNRRANELIYSLHTKKKTPLTLLRKLRQGHPELGDKEFLEEYGEYDLEVWGDLRFAGSKLTYLCISKAETL